MPGERHRVNQRPAVVHSDVIEEAHLTGPHVDLDHRHVTHVSHDRTEDAKVGAVVRRQRRERMIVGGGSLLRYLNLHPPCTEILNPRPVVPTLGGVLLFASRTYLCRLSNPAAEDGADDAGKRNHRQHGEKSAQRGGSGAAGNASAATKKGAGVDDAGTLSRSG